jgi:hypothetical protein
MNQRCLKYVVSYCATVLLLYACGERRDIMIARNGADESRLASSRVGPLLLDPRHTSLFRDLTDILGARLHTVCTDLTRQETIMDRRRQC